MKEPNAITIMGETGQPEAMFQAPTDRTVAANLWVYLVENLRPGLTVELSLPELGILTNETAVKIPVERYTAIMNQEEHVFDQPQ